MTIGQATEQLEQEQFHIVHVDDIPAVIQVLLQVLVQVLKDKSEELLRVDNVMQCDNVSMFEVLEQQQFPDGGAGGSFFVF